MNSFMNMTIQNIIQSPFQLLIITFSHPSITVQYSIWHYDSTTHQPQQSSMLIIHQHTSLHSIHTHTVLHCTVLYSNHIPSHTCFHATTPKLIWYWCISIDTLSHHHPFMLYYHPHTHIYHNTQQSYISD